MSNLVTLLVFVNDICNSSMDMKNTYKKYKEKKKEKILLIYGLLPRGGGGQGYLDL